MRILPFDRWPFVARLLYDPIRALDLVDTEQRPDHGKVIPVCVVAAIVVLKVLSIPITVMEMTVLLTAAFGQSAWRTFLRAKTLTGVANTTVSVASARTETVQRQIVERRDPDLGVDPTHD